MENENNDNSPPFDPTVVGCRVLDVQTALQKAFAEFTSQGDGTLDGLALSIQAHLAEVPAFLIQVTPGPDTEG